MSEAVSPEEVAKVFVDAVAWGEHHTVWDLLSAAGRKVVLRVGAMRGMDQDLADRLGEGTAATAEREEFLTDLVSGLRADLTGNDLDNLVAEQVEAATATPGRAMVMLVLPLPPALGIAGLPVAEVEMTEEAGQWRVDKLVPRTSKPK
ncbi:MAG: hypothetical protein H0X58_05075 [Acidimicrobiia bacterium]|nr:hypothetical protein [Acidimicrobiia bacterium]